MVKQNQSKEEPLVFIVEDDPVLLELYAKKFSASGLQVASATDGEAALESLRKAKELPDLVILDLMLPKLEGKEVLRIIRQDEKLRDLRVVVMTNRYEPGLKEQIQKLGVEAYWLKAAYTPVEMVAKVKSLLENSK